LCRNGLRQPDGAQFRPGNLVDDEEWEADYYHLKRRYFSTLDAYEKSKKVRPGNLVDDDEWEANYYDLKRRYFWTLDADKKSK
jgi:helix-turn-helix protein